jgi:hypothetical protein
MPIRAHAAGSLDLPRWLPVACVADARRPFFARACDVSSGAARDRYRVYTLDEFLADGFGQASLSTSTSGHLHGAGRGSRLVGAAVLVVVAGTVTGLVVTVGLPRAHRVGRSGSTRLAAVAHPHSRRLRSDVRTSSRSRGDKPSQAVAGPTARGSERRSSVHTPRRGGDRRRRLTAPSSADGRTPEGQPAVERPAVERRVVDRLAAEHPAAEPSVVERSSSSVAPVDDSTQRAAAATATATEHSSEFGFEH